MVILEKVIKLNGCPVCNSKVKGNDKIKYFCRNCNLLFDKNDLNDKKNLKKIT